MVDRDISMFENMAYIILEDFATRYSKDDRDTLTRYLQKTFNDSLIANGVTVGKDSNVPTKWISVEERLPEIGQEVLVYKGKYIGDMMNTYSYLGEDKWEDDYGYYGTNDEEGITHWMPLPQPPKEVDNG